ncbi:unnamed protein product [Bursaphelenchus okinawaensis]|uniref:Uncharacterized protein n=1 Tax=Bursaphelenchus okinawaensis TaxID=465554 RepID=A0A811KAU0_9BILA|nr:unnamed protein product [Bursaphelenchus okinawaensis]CAG9095681.1 unnamed protein product [Bursaphelenchus okinawaensis]
MYNPNMGMGQYPQRMAPQSHMMTQEQHAQMMHHQQMLAQPQHMMAQNQYQRPPMVPPNQQTPPQETQKPKKPIFDRVKALIPPPLPFEILDKTGDMSITELCIQGREIVNELSIRFMNVITSLKMDRKNAVVDIEATLVYIRFLFKKLLEIRIRIDRSRINKPRVTEEQFLDYITEPGEVASDPEVIERRNQVSAMADKNRIALVSKSNKIKKIEYLAAVLDPQFQNI